MKTSKNTILIIGGTAGIGYETAKQLSALDNHVIITGRDKDRLESAASTLDNVTAINFDVTNPEQVDALVLRLKTDFPAFNMVINNAGKAFAYSLDDPNADAFDNAETEMLTNYLAIIRLNQKLLPILKEKTAAAIVNVSSIVAYVPGVSLPTYSASKAALHSYTTALRFTLADTTVKVFELMPPLVNTEFSKEIGGHNGIEPSVVAKDLVDALANDTYQIRVGNTAQIYELLLTSPENAMAAMNGK